MSGHKHKPSLHAKNVVHVMNIFVRCIKLMQLYYMLPIPKQTTWYCGSFF